MSLYDTAKRMLKIGTWSQRSARWIDEIYKKSTVGILAKILESFKVRLISTVLFVPSTLIDTLSSFTIVLTSKLRKLFASELDKEKFEKRANKYYENGVKNGLAFMSFPLAIIFPKLVSFYFIPKREKYGHILSGGHLYDVRPEIQYPEKLADLKRLIQQANDKGRKVTVVGAGRSQGQQYLPAKNNGIVINMSHFNTVKVNPKSKTVTVGAGATWGDIQVEANKHALAVKVMQASNVFSVGGSISTNIHGWNKDGVLANTIRSLTIINAQGKLQTLKPTGELFQYVVGGYNQFGVIVSAEIDLVDNENLVEKSTLVRPSDYLKYFKESVEENDNVRMHLYRLSLSPSHMLQEGVAVNYISTHKTKVKSADGFHLEPPSGTRFERIFLNFARRFSFVRKLLWSYEKSRLLNNETKMTTNEIMQPSINAMFNNALSESEWLQEFFIPGENLDTFLKQLGSLLTANNVTLLNATVRYVKQDTVSKMGYANNADRFAVVLCFNQSLKEEEIIKTKRWVREAIDLSLSNGGTYYLPYQAFASKEQFDKAYPTAKSVYKKKLEVDPNGTFTSGFSSKYFTSTHEHNHYRQILSTKEGREQFGQFLDNILDRVDKDKLYALLDNIFSYCDDNKEIYQELSRRISEVMPNIVNSSSRIMRSLRNIKADLSEQAYELMGQNVKKPVNGLIEIGFPGRFVRPLRSKLDISGEVTVLNDAESALDVIQSGFPRPYHRFLPLNDYAPLSPEKFKDNSVDMITCFIGLHHIPEHKIDDFLKSLNRVLRPGGTFLLMDHDVINETTRDMACMAHSIYNAVMGVSLEEEMNEIRNFQSLKYWQDRLKQHGFEVQLSPKRMVRHGDPSENVMIRLVKKAECCSQVNKAHDHEKGKGVELPTASKICTPLYQTRRNPERKATRQTAHNHNKVKDRERKLNYQSSRHTLCS